MCCFPLSLLHLPFLRKKERETFQGKEDALVAGDSKGERIGKINDSLLEKTEELEHLNIPDS